MPSLLNNSLHQFAINNSKDVKATLHKPKIKRLSKDEKLNLLATCVNEPSTINNNDTNELPTETAIHASTN